jgi:hypothetical protein
MLMFAYLDEKIKRFMPVVIPIFLILTPLLFVFLLFNSKQKKEKESIIKVIQEFYRYELMKNPPDMEN